MASKKLKIFIHSMDGTGNFFSTIQKSTGHINACVGLAEALVKRGHSVLFLLNSAHKGNFAKFGFDEYLLERAKSTSQNEPPSTEQVNPVKVFAQIMIKSGMFSDKSPMERMRDLAGKKDESFVVKLYESTRDFNPQIQRAMDEHKPDLFILDHFIVPPALPKSGIPWLYLFSGSPTAILDSPDLPPFTSGYSVNGDRTDWDEFRSYRKAFRDLYIKYQTLLYQEFDYEPTEEDFPLPRGSYPQCKYGYIYGYPEELDYHDVIRIPENYIRVDGFCRESTEPFQLPEGFRKESEKLIFFSLGSMGGVDVELMKRVTSILSKTPHKTIVSKGPLADDFHASSMDPDDEDLDVDRQLMNVLAGAQNDEEDHDERRSQADDPTPNRLQRIGIMISTYESTGSIAHPLQQQAVERLHEELDRLWNSNISEEAFRVVTELMSRSQRLLSASSERTATLSSASIPSAAAPREETMLTRITYDPKEKRWSVPLPWYNTDRPQNNRAAVYKATQHQSIYMDDVFYLGPDLATIQRLIEVSSRVLKAASFPLHKWACPEWIQREGLLVENHQEVAGCLGVRWGMEGDHCCLKPPSADVRQFTRRGIAQVIGRLHDVLGLLGPFSTRLKLLMKDTLTGTRGWDTPVEEAVQDAAKDVFAEFSLVEQLSLPRVIRSSEDFELIGFGDASRLAYGAAVYLWERSSQQMNLLASRSRVVSEKRTMPELELCAAVLLVDLAVSSESLLLDKKTLSLGYDGVIRFLTSYYEAMERNTGLIARENAGLEQKLSAAQLAVAAAWRLFQRVAFRDEVNLLRVGKPLPSTSRLGKLNVFLDAQKVMRLDRRLKEAPLDYEAKYPIVAVDHPFVRGFLERFHSMTMAHSSHHRTLVEVNNMLYLPRCSDILRSVLDGCMRCRFLHGKPFTAPPAPLPADRVNNEENLPFNHVGVDLFGPLITRGAKAQYGMIFVCCNTRAEKPVDPFLINYATICEERDKLWTRLRKEYLTSLRQFHRHGGKTREPEIGELVLLVGSCKREDWDWGRVQSLMRGPDGIVRAASLLMPNGNIWERPVQSLIPLESSARRGECGAATSAAVPSSTDGSRANALEADQPSIGSMIE
ncbi:hypothetical protein TYRP_001903 [Tyrophagus putrescentiae]|nr:hypothetical protein TYRP_001903 [Tyrophagus putrescentiae]